MHFIHQILIIRILVLRSKIVSFFVNREFNSLLAFPKRCQDANKTAYTLARGSYVLVYPFYSVFPPSFIEEVLLVESS